MTASLATLNPAALVTLADCEQRIERGLRSFVDIGQALAEIRDGRLYKGTHESFEAYCHERWDIGRDYADRMIAGASVVLTIVSNGLPAPTKESQARALVAVPEAERAEVWRKAVERTNGKPTAKAVEDVLAERDVPAKPERATRGAKTPDRKPLGPKPTAEVEAPDDELLDTVVSVLTDAGPFGKSTAEIWTKTTVHSARVAAALELLAEQGRVTSTEAANGTARWALSETPGTDGAAQEPPAVRGATPEPDGATAPPSGSGTTPAPAVDAPMPSRGPDQPGASSPAPGPRTLTLVTDAAEVEAAVRRDARAHLSRLADLAWSPNWPADHVEHWAATLGPVDDELADILDRAEKAKAVLTDLIARCGR